MTFLVVLLWILKIIWIVALSVILLCLAMLCFSLSVEVNLKPDKYKVTFRWLNIIKYDFPRRKVKEKSENKDEIHKEGAHDADKKILGIIDKNELKTEVSSLWDSDTCTFDYQGFYDLTEKYMGIIREAKQGIYAVFGYFKKKMKLKSSTLYIKYGIGEPDKTGIAYGVIYGVHEVMLSLIGEYIEIKDKPQLYLDADYVNKVFEYELDFVIKLRLIHILVAMAIGYVRYRKLNNN